MNRKELVEKMLIAAAKASTRAGCTWPGKRGQFSAERLADLRGQMNAALTVAIAELQLESAPKKIRKSA